MSGFTNEVVNAKNVDFSGGSPVAAKLVANGQMLIGATALNAGGTHINVGTLTSPDASVTIGYTSPNITLQVVPSTPITLTGSTGGALSPTAGNFNILPGANAGTSVVFNGSGSTLSLNFADANDNIFVGRVSGSGLPGPANVGFGTGTLQNLNTGQWNTAVGFVALNAVSSGQRNTSVGFQSMPTLTTGSTNIAIGYNAGSAFTSSETNNINLANDGVVGNSNTIRIGNATHTRFFGAGITGVAITGGAITLCDSSGQLGTLAVGSSGQILQSGGASTPSFSTATYPATAGTSGNVLTSDGTNWTSATLPSQLNVATVTLTSAQIKALHATPIQFIAAPGSGKVICLVAPMWVNYAYGGTNVFVAAASQTISPYYGTTTAATANPAITNTNLINNVTSINVVPIFATTLTMGAAATTYRNIAVNLYNPVVTEISGNAGNNNTITFTALYYIATL